MTTSSGVSCRTRETVVTETEFPTGPRDQAQQKMLEAVEAIREKKSTGQFIIHFAQGGFQRMTLVEKQEVTIEG